jgi:hypothetical protein
MVDGAFGFEIPGAVGQKFLIESSADLIQWTETLRGTIDDSGVIPFTNTGSTSGHFFFRAQILP